MSETPEMAARHDAVLRRVQALSLALAEDLAACALATEDEDKKVRLASAYHKITRGLRQSVALEAKLVRDAEAAARAAQDRARAEADAERKVTELKREARKAFLRDTVRRLVWSEVEDQEDEDQIEEAEDRLRDLETEVGFEAQEEDFLETPAAVQIQRICQSLGLKLAANDEAEEPGEREEPGAEAGPNSS